MLGVGICGIILTADFTKPWGGLSAADWGLLFVSWAGDVAIVYLVVEYIDEIAWKKVEIKVMELIRRELMGIAADIAIVSGVSPVATILPLDGTEEDEQDAYRRATLDRMKQFSADVAQIRTAVQSQGFLFVGGYGPLFSHRAQRLADFQIRYSRFLDAKLVMLMMDLEGHLKSLDSDVAIVQKKVLLASFYQDDAYHQLQALLKRIVIAAENNEIEIAPR
jgi:hypothetical protein